MSTDNGYRWKCTGCGATEVVEYCGNPHQLPPGWWHWHGNTTRTIPGATPIGYDTRGTLCRVCNTPVFAALGVDPEDILNAAQQSRDRARRRPAEAWDEGDIDDFEMLEPEPH